MAHVRLTPDALADLERIVEHLRQHESADADTRAGEIMDALEILTGNPLIGRPARSETRELVIGRRSRGYVALYRWLPIIDSVLVLAIRAQREGGYASDA